MIETRQEKRKEGFIQDFIEKHDFINKHQRIIGTILGLVLIILFLLSFYFVDIFLDVIVKLIIGKQNSGFQIFESIVFVLAFFPPALIIFLMAGMIIGYKFGKEQRVYIIIRLILILLLFLISVYITAIILGIIRRFF